MLCGPGGKLGFARQPSAGPTRAAPGARPGLLVGWGPKGHVVACLAPVVDLLWRHLPHDAALAIERAPALPLAAWPLSLRRRRVRALGAFPGAST